jgi:hypothetical protein
MKATIPHDMGATLPTVARLTDSRFRRARKVFRLDVADAVELTAFLHIVPPEFARWIFGWKRTSVLAAREFLADPRLNELAAPLVVENIHALSVDVGLAILKAMQDGGWRARNTAPKIVMDTIAELRANGTTPERIAEATGLRVETVWKWSRPKSNRAESQRARAAAALVL